MARQRYINTKFWDDNYITTLNPVEKLLFIYFLTNPLTNICGIYEIQVRRITFDTGIEEKEVKKIMTKFSKDQKIYHIVGWLCVVNFTKHQAVNNKIKKGISLILKDIPKKVIDSIRKRDRYYIDTLSISYPYPLNYDNDNTNDNNNSPSDTSSFKKKPTFRGDDMREKPVGSGKWWVLPKDGGDWLEYAGDLKEIEWK